MTPDRAEVQYDDIFVCRLNDFMIVALAYALQAKAENPDYKFAVVIQKMSDSAKERAIRDVGGDVFDEASATTAGPTCGRMVIHSFGLLMEWQEKVRKLVTFSRVGVYTDFMKNEFDELKLKELGATSVIFYGWRYLKKNLPSDISLEVVKFPYCFKAYEILSKFSIRSPIKVDVGNFEADTHVIFLRYWGGGPYIFVDGTDLGDVVVRGLKGLEIGTLYVKGDARITNKAFDGVMEKLRLAGYAPRSFTELFSGLEVTDKELKHRGGEALPAEILLEGLKGRRFTAHTYDSSLCFFLRLVNDAKIVFPKLESISDAFVNPSAYRTVEHYASIYEEVCAKLDANEDKSAIHDVVR